MTSTLKDILHDPDQSSTSLFQDSNYYDSDSYLNLTSNKNQTDYFTLFNTNSRSLLKHKSEYDVLFQALDSHLSFDMLSFTESWLDEKIEELVTFDGYVPITRHKFPNKEGGGIAVYLKNDKKYKIRHDLSFCGNKTHLYDGIFIEIINPNSTNGNILIFVMYRTPSHNSVPEFTADLNAILEKVKHEKKRTVITGDLNIDLLKYNSNNQTSNFLDMLISNNLTPRITLPTRITHTSATLIDHIFSNSDLNKSIAGTITTDITDHYCNFIHINTKLNKHETPKYIRYRKQDVRSIDNFNNALANTDWSCITQMTDPNSAYESLINTYTALMD